MSSKEKEYIQQLFNNYLRYNNCYRFNIVKNKTSIADVIFDSGGTTIRTVIMENKKRNIPVYQYNETILEKNKYKNLMLAKSLLNCPVLYCTEYVDGLILIYDLTDREINNWSVQSFPLFYGSSETINKEIAYLDYATADFIISKKTWNRINYDQLKNYIESKTVYA